MRRNGHSTSLRVLLSGSAADRIAPELSDHPAISVVRPVHEGAALRLPRAVDVALFVVESSSAPELGGEIRDVRSLSEAPLILAAYGEPNGIVEMGLSVGASDVIVLPQSVETLMFALHKASRTNGADIGSGEIVTVFSPKGGSGKTALATNIAVVAAQSNLRTLLVDLDLQFGDAALALGVSARATIADFAGSHGEVDAEKLSAFISKENRTGLSLLPAPKRPEEAQMIGQTEIGGILDAARGAYDAVVIDTGPTFDGAMLAALDRTDRLLLVCNPEITSLKNVRIGLETLERLKFPRDRVMVVANRLGAAGGVSRNEIEEALEAQIDFDLPDDAAVPASVNRAVPAALMDKDGRFSRAVARLAHSLFSGATIEATVAPERRFALRGRR
jgi:MinD-like ATPase involved in chromosome partitioning or flagellar assembly